MANIRWIAVQILDNVIHQGQSLTVALEQANLSSLKNTQDKAFVQAVSYGVIRWYHRLDYILQKLLIKPLKDNQVKMLALVGLYQLAFMRVKQHAAIYETVAAVNKKPWAKALINAVLRRFQREQQTFDLLVQEEKQAAVSHPKWIIDLLRLDWPDHYEQLLEQNNVQPPMMLRVNLQKTTPKDYLELLKVGGKQGNTIAANEAAIKLAIPCPVEELPGFGQGIVSIQDGAAQLAAQLLVLQSGQTVLDLCAAPGGKTVHILETEPGLASLTALDIDHRRIKKIEENLVRAGLSALLLQGDASQPEEWWDGQSFDRILVDAPCSALGVIRRHPDIKLLRQSSDLENLRQMQYAILKSAWFMLKPGGLLVYATCSVVKQENELQVQRFLDEFNDARELPIEAAWGLHRPVGRQIITGENDMDGFYYARIQKS